MRGERGAFSSEFVFVSEGTKGGLHIIFCGDVVCGFEVVFAWGFGLRSVLACVFYCLILRGMTVGLSC